MTSTARKPKSLAITADQARAFATEKLSQIRVPVVPQPTNYSGSFECSWYFPTIVRRGTERPGKEVYGFADADHGWVSPVGAPGDVLLLKETCALRVDVDPKKNLAKAMHYIVYRADREPGDDLSMDWHSYSKWRTTPLWAVRFRPTIAAIRCERVNAITEEDAKKCGAEQFGDGHSYCVYCKKETQFEYGPSRLPSFASTWDSRYGKKFPWTSNPWCWVIDLVPGKGEHNG